MDNDIDKPFISGSLYNTTNPILSTLPKQDHITTLSSKTFNIESKEEIKLKIGESHIIFTKDDTITIKQKDNTITLDNEGISIKGKKIIISKGES